MPIIRISDRAMTLIRANVRPGHTFVQNGKRRPDGTWDVPIEDDTLDRLNEHRLTGESDSDVVERVLTKALCGGLS